MSAITQEALLEILDNDLDLLETLVEHGLIPSGLQSFVPDEVETILVCRTLVREMEVNWAGVEVIVRMRRQLLMTRRRLAELAGEDS